MGYTTDFEGAITIDPPLNGSEIAYINKFSSTRRMNRTKGPYFIDGDGFMGQDDRGDVIDGNSPDPTQPGLWCQWNVNDDEIFWDGNEKFYSSAEWMTYIIDHFLKEGAEASKANDPQFKDFTFNHVCNGSIYAQGEDPNDMWKLEVTGNSVVVRDGTVTYE